MFNIIANKKFNINIDIISKIKFKCFLSRVGYHRIIQFP